MPAGIYALKVWDEVVYVGLSQDLDARLRQHFYQLRRGAGLAARFPEVFEGSEVTAEVLTTVDVGPEPHDVASDEHSRWWMELRHRLIAGEREFIQKYLPKCNTRGKSIRESFTENPSSFRVVCPSVIEPSAQAGGADRLSDAE